ncbi:MAG: dihydropteroate synthase [Gemmatimonadales bacterium]
MRRGVERGRADAAAQGLKPHAIIVEGLTERERDALVAATRAHGIECFCGDDWVLLAAATARLAGLLRAAASELPEEISQRLGTHLQWSVEAPVEWRMRRGAVELDRPVLVGILNVTPDSFSDGGNYMDPDRALERADQLVAAGADMIDVGAESTRPGHPDPVPMEEEWRRLEPVLAGLRRRHPDLPISVDTVKAAVADRALEAGAWAINDVSGLRLDPEIADVCARHDAGLVLMHSRGSIQTMATYDHAEYESVTAELVGELAAATVVARERGVRRERLVVDPGLGFSKRPEHNYRVLAELATVAALGLPVMVGPSRKRFLGAVTGKDVSDRDQATAAACAVAYLFGAHLFRVHAVDAARDALAVAHAVRSA